MDADGGERGAGKGAAALVPASAHSDPGAQSALRHLGYAGGWNSTLGTYFKKLNEGWDAEPGAPEPHVRADETGLTLTFFLNPQLNPQFRDYDRGELFFPNCWRYRLGYPNDEGWYKGHCRFRCLAPDWGDFYEVSGDLLDSGPPDWVLLRSDHSGLSRHFLFYFKDETFECDAGNWDFKVLPVSDADFERLRASERRITLPRVTLLSVLRDVAFEPVRTAQRWLRR
jgi:hypothetical protein